MASKKFTNRSQSAVFILIILGLVAVVNYVSTKWFMRLDLTETKEYSISQASKNMLKGLDDLINIKVYFSKNLPPHLQRLESGIRDLLTEFKAYAGGNLRVTWQDPADDEEVKNEVRAMGVPEVQLQTFEKDKAQAMKAFLGIAVLYADKKEVLPVVQDIRNLEYDLAQAVMKVFRSETPKIGVMKTDTMPFIPPRMMQQMNMKDQTKEKYKPIYDNLQPNYDVKDIDISEGQKIDSTIRTLIIPGGDEKSFTERDLFEIDQFFMDGGNLIVLVDAVALSFQYGASANTQEPRIMKLMEHYGVGVRKDIVLDASCGQVQIPQRFGQFTMNVAVNYPFFVRIGESGFNHDNPAVSGLSDMILPWVSPLKLMVDEADSAAQADSAAVKATVLVRSSPKSWLDEGPAFNLNPQQDWGMQLNENADKLQQHPVAVYLNGNFESYFKGKSVPPVKEIDTSDTNADLSANDKDKDRTITPSNTDRHLVVIGDSDFLTAQNAAPGNITFLLNIVDWLTLDENLIGIRSRALVDRTIRNDQLQKGSSLPNLIRAINILTMPLVLIIIGLILFFRRRETVEVKPAAAQKTVTGQQENKKETEQ
jgi:gliding-associated putative ABC transporter substrate-binding component GldG